MNVSEIMERDLPTVKLDDAVETVVKVMREHEVPGVPVVDGDGMLRGIITENDLILRDEEADFHVPFHIELMGGVVYLGRFKDYDERLKRAIALTAEELMTADPVTVGPDQSVDEAARIIAEERHNRLPVVEDGKLVGVVTRLDVLDALTRG